MLLNINPESIGNILEMAMLISFGLSWPLNLIKSYKARTAKGTSVFFYIVLEIGYIAGALSKIVKGKVNYVIAFYCLNFALIMCCIIVYFRNVKLDKQASQAKPEEAE